MIYVNFKTRARLCNLIAINRVQLKIKNIAKNKFAFYTHYIDTFNNSNFVYIILNIYSSTNFYNVIRYNMNINCTQIKKY